MRLSIALDYGYFDLPMTLEEQIASIEKGIKR
jgi:hypothetical protein